jgi:hypothetical protein
VKDVEFFSTSSIWNQNKRSSNRKKNRKRGRPQGEEDVERIKNEDSAEVRSLIRELTGFFNHSTEV